MLFVLHFWIIFPSLQQSPFQLFVSVFPKLSGWFRLSLLDHSKMVRRLTCNLYHNFHASRFLHPYLASNWITGVRKGKAQSVRKCLATNTEITSIKGKCPNVLGSRCILEWLIKRLTSFRSCLVKNAESTLTASNWVPSFDNILCAAITASVFNTSNNWNRGDTGSRFHCSSRSAHDEWIVDEDILFYSKMKV